MTDDTTRKAYAMTKIYDQQRAAFAHVSAYVILKDGERVATVAFKFGGRVTAYVHWIGLEMTRGFAGGGGYDRQSAAVIDAARKTKGGDAPKSVQLNADAFLGALDARDGSHWYDNLRQAGFTVLQAV